MDISKRSYLELALLGLAYVLTGLFGISLVSITGTALTMVWLPSGIGAVMAIRFGQKGIGAVLLSSFIVNAPFYFEDNPADWLHWLSVSLMACSIDALQSFLVMVFYKKYRQDLVFSELNIRLIRAVLSILLLPTLFTSWMLLLMGNYHFEFLDGSLYTLFKNYMPIFMADTTGIFLVLSLLMVFPQWRSVLPLMNTKGLLLLLSLILIPLLAAVHQDFMYLSFISLLLLTYLFHQKGAVLGVFVLNAVTILLVASGILTFGSSENLNQTYGHTLVFIFSTGLIFYLMSVLFSETEEKAKLLIQQSKMATMGEMVNAISHQWKQPLTAAWLIVDRLEERLNEGDCSKQEIGEELGKVRLQLRQMNDTVTDFRDFLKPTMKKTDFKIAQTANEVYYLNEAKFKQFGIGFYLHGDTELMLHGNPNEMKQVLLNLYSNACDVLEKSANREKSIHVYIEREGEEALLRVCDNGGGIAADLLPDRLFEYYVTTKGDEGTGIGLNISKTIIESKFHGKLWAQNTDTGAEFIIELPLAKSAVS